MNYDLRNKIDRKKFVSYANNLLKKQRARIVLQDESDRTISQNSYLHVLIRILAIETGVKEAYSKEVYFKRLANPGLFIRIVENPITGDKTEYLRSTTELTVEEMSLAISRFRMWAEENGYYLPEAELNDGEMVFTSEEDKEAFLQGERETSKLDNYIK